MPVKTESDAGLGYVIVALVDGHRYCHRGRSYERRGREDSSSGSAKLHL